MILWTNGLLHTARHIYEAEGFRLVHEEKEQIWGGEQVEQTWELDL